MKLRAGHFACLVALSLLASLAACAPQAEVCGLSGTMPVPAEHAATPEQPVAESSQDPSFDEPLARELGADEYGMAPYVMALLKAGPNRSQSEAEATELQAAHMANIQRLADAGKLVLAGPFFDEGELRGIYVFDVATIEEARALTETDPAIQAGRLTLELHPWYGSAALRQVNAVHERISKTKI